MTKKKEERLLDLIEELEQLNIRKKVIEKEIRVLQDEKKKEEVMKKNKFAGKIENGRAYDRNGDELIPNVTKVKMLTGVTSFSPMRRMS